MRAGERIRPISRAGKLRPALFQGRRAPRGTCAVPPTRWVSVSPSVIWNLDLSLNRTKTRPSLLILSDLSLCRSRVPPTARGSSAFEHHRPYRSNYYKLTNTLFHGSLCLQRNSYTASRPGKRLPSPWPLDTGLPHFGNLPGSFPPLGFCPCKPLVAMLFHLHLKPLSQP